jgi:hypothetical protein
MRTTVTLDPDVAARLRKLALRRQSSFKVALNDALRRGLTAQERAVEPEPFAVAPHPSGFRPGVDPGRLNQLLDEIEARDLVPARRRRR